MIQHKNKKTIRDKAVEWNNRSTKKVPYEFIDFVEGKSEVIKQKKRFLYTPQFIAKMNEVCDLFRCKCGCDFYLHYDNIHKTYHDIPNFCSKCGTELDWRDINRTSNE